MRNVFYIFFVLICLIDVMPIKASTTAEDNFAFKDIQLNLTNANFLTAEEAATANAPTVSFGIAIAEDGTQQRVPINDASANIVLTNYKYHSKEHGLNPGTATVKVPGYVKISIGTCAYGGDVTIKDAQGATVVTMSTNNGKCYHNEHTYAEAFYKGEATTLTITGGKYIPYLAIEAVNEVPTNSKIIFSPGEYTNVGTLPNSVEIETGKTYTLPFNRTLYVDNKTLTTWWDGTDYYTPGQTITVSKDLTLTPVFTDNKVSLASRQSEVSITWDFQTKNGAPQLVYEGKPGIYVSQAIVNEQTIDVKIDFTTSPGKINNTSNTDWAQMNTGTTLVFPAAKNCILTFQSYNATTTTTIAGEKGYTVGNDKITTFKYGGSDPTIDFVIGDGSYFRYFTIVYPKIEFNLQERAIYATDFKDWTSISGAGDASGSIEKNTNFSNEKLSFSLKGINAVPQGTNSKFPGIVGYLMAEKNATGTIVTNALKSISKVRFYHGATGNSRGYKLEKKSATDTDWIVLSNAYADPATGVWVECPINEENVQLRWTNLNMTQNAYLFEMEIYAKVEITVPQVTLQVNTSSKEAGTVSVSPSSSQYDQGTEVTLTAQRSFGHKFVKWIDAGGKTLSTKPTFILTLTKDLVATALFESIPTYVLTTKTEGGANNYMIKASPDATVINGENRYEENTRVTLTATENPILKFTNWKKGQTTSELTITMDADKEHTAIYSAMDYIVGWDFNRKGGTSRAADFFSTNDNQTAALNLRKADGTLDSWLDKSAEAAGGYEGESAAVNWKDIEEKFYYEAKINAKDFTGIKVTSKMLYNYNAYSIQKLEYSLNGTDFKEAAKIKIEAAKTWTPLEAILPAECDHAEVLHLRWIPDYNSDLTGTVSKNDGTAISAIYVTGTTNIIGGVPKLLSIMPANNAINISSTGRIVLTFDRNVKLTSHAVATLGNKTLIPIVTGKTIIFPYMGLNYSNDYTFKLSANSVSDLTDCILPDAISSHFATITQPNVVPGSYDAIVTNADELLDALTKGNEASTSGVRYRIFLHDGTYDLGSKCLTDVKSNISLIGESMTNTIIVNQAPQEGISVSATLRPTGENIYMQDLTIKNAYDYNGSTGRAVCLQDKGNKNVYKNVRLLSYQDTYYSNNNRMRSYFEDCEIHGTVDFICGGGDVYFNRTLLYLENRPGNCITAPAGDTDWGYVFNDCTIDGSSSNKKSYALGRPWQGAPMSVWINTTMKILPKDEGWSDMSETILPKLFGEYNSHTADGTQVDCTKRKTKYTAGTVAYNPVLSTSDAAKFTLENVLGGTDSWLPALLTEQITTPVVRINASTLSWDESKHAFCYAICKNGKVIDFTNNTTYTLPADATNNDKFSVRIANEMGGLGKASNDSSSATGVEQNIAEKEIIERQYFNANGLRINCAEKGLNIVRLIYSDGSTATFKEVVK